MEIVAAGAPQSVYQSITMLIISTFNYDSAIIMLKAFILNHEYCL